MDDALANRILSFSRSANPSQNDIETSLMEALGTPLGVEDARNGFSGLLRAAREGSVQLVGRRGEDLTVVISVKKLAAFIQAATRPLTYGDLLDAMNYHPVHRPRVMRESRPRHKLVRYRPTQAKSA